jgi:hypothetical protein
MNFQSNCWVESRDLGQPGTTFGSHPILSSFTSKTSVAKGGIAGGCGSPASPYACVWWHTSLAMDVGLISAPPCLFSVDNHACSIQERVQMRNAFAAQDGEASLPSCPRLISMTPLSQPPITCNSQG